MSKHKEPEREESRRMPRARSLEEAVNADNSLEGYAAMNATGNDEIARIAYELYEQRGREHGFHEQDWYRAEQIVKDRRTTQQREAGSSSGSGTPNESSRSPKK